MIQYRNRQCWHLKWTKQGSLATGLNSFNLQKHCCHYLEPIHQFQTLRPRAEIINISRHQLWLWVAGHLRGPGSWPRARVWVSRLSLWVWEQGLRVHSELGGGLAHKESIKCRQRQRHCYCLSVVILSHCPNVKANTIANCLTQQTSNEGSCFFRPYKTCVSYLSV